MHRCCTIGCSIKDPIPCYNNALSRCPGVTWTASHGCHCHPERRFSTEQQSSIAMLWHTSDWSNGHGDPTLHTTTRETPALAKKPLFAGCSDTKHLCSIALWRRMGIDDARNNDGDDPAVVEKEPSPQSQKRHHHSTHNDRDLQVAYYYGTFARASVISVSN
jgi:hypothetical protein